MPQAGSGRRFRRPTSSTSTPPRPHPMRAGSRPSSPWGGSSFPGRRGVAARSRSSSVGPLAALPPIRPSPSASSAASGRRSRPPQAPAATPWIRARSGCAPTALPTPPRPPSTTTSGSPAIRCKPLASFAFSTLGADDDALLDGLQPRGAVRDEAVENEGRRRAADGIARRRLRDRIVRDDRVWRPAAGAKPRRPQKHRPSCHARHPQNPPDRKVPRALAGIKRRRAPSRIRPASVAFWARKRERPGTRPGLRFKRDRRRSALDLGLRLRVAELVGLLHGLRGTAGAARRDHLLLLHDCGVVDRALLHDRAAAGEPVFLLDGGCLGIGGRADNRGGEENREFLHGLRAPEWTCGGATHAKPSRSSLTVLNLGRSGALIF